MDTIITRIFFHNWQRKVLALICGIIVWLFVSSTITDTKTLANVPIRIVNLPSDKTIVGLLPNRMLSKRVALTLSGTKDVIQDLESGDLEVLLDVSTADSNDWVVKIAKKNLVSLNPSIDLVHHITSVSHPEFVLKITSLVTEKIPVTVMIPVGEAPQGYEFLDIWPRKLMQTVSGSEEDIEALKAKGLQLTVNLSEISKAELDAIQAPTSGIHDDEIVYRIPNKWKKIAIPPSSNVYEEINDHDAENLRIEFLRKSFVTLDKPITVDIFYPIKYSEAVNPATHPIAYNAFMQRRNNLSLLNTLLMVRDVSHLFLNTVIENMQIRVLAAPKTERELLQWSLEVVAPHELEDMFVAFLLSNPNTTKQREASYRQRFRNYLQRLQLYSAEEARLNLECTLEPNSIKVVVIK